jgi:signal transduction histidine kinase/CheY-like chemotaxis protein
MPTLDRLKPAALFAFVFGAILVATVLGYASYLAVDNVAGVWPATGVVLVALLRSSRGRWWITLASMLCAQVGYEQITGRQTLLVSAMFGVVNTIEPTVAALLLYRFLGGDRALDRLPRLLALLVVGAGIAPALGATIGAWIVTSLYPAASYATVWGTWRSADSLGVLMTAPLLLTLGASADLRARSNRLARSELVVYVLVLALVAEETLGPARLPFTLIPRLPYAIFPVLLWASVRLSPMVATASMAAVGAYAIAQARFGLGPFAVTAASALAQILALQTLLTVLAVNTLASLVLALEYARAEHERMEVELKRVRSQRMEAVGRLAAGVAHDFNNILAIVAGNGELLERELARPALDRVEAEECVRQQRNAAKRGKLMVQQLIALVRRDPVEPETIDLNATVRAIEPMLPHLVGEQVKLEVQTGSEPAHTRVDAVRIETAILNLLSNARDAMPHGGHLWLSVTTTPTEVALSVRDTGTGIEPENLLRVREAFYTTKPPERGIGLGLTTVCETVERAGGRVELASKLGEGTTVVCHLPHVSVEPARVLAHAPVQRSERVRILLCEDEDAVRTVAQKFLSSAGYEVVEASDGYTALKLLHQEHVDLLLTDVALPAMTGFALVDRVAAIRPGLQVLYMSGSADDERLAQPGAGPRRDEILRKPFTRAELLARVCARVGPGQ